MSDPHDLHWLATTVLEEELARHSLVGVLSAEVNNAHGDLSGECVAATSSSQLYFNIHTVVDDDVERILELHHFISHAAHRDSLLLFGLDDAVALNDLPDSVSVFREGGVLCVDLADVGDLEGITLFLQYCDLTEVELLLVKLDVRATRRGKDQHHDLVGVTIDLHDEVRADWAKNLRLELHIYNLGLVWLNHTAPHVDIIDGHALALLVLRLDLKSGLQVVLVDDLDLLGLRVLQETVVELEELVGRDAYFWHNALSLDRHC